MSNAFDVLNEDEFARIGKYVVAVSQLMAVTSLIVLASEGSTRADQRWVTASGGPGKLHKAMSGLVESRGPDDPLVGFWFHAQQLMNERNQIVHSLVLQSDPTAPKRYRQPRQLVQTKDGTTRGIPTTDETDAFLRRASDLCGVAYRMAEEIRVERSK